MVSVSGSGSSPSAMGLAVAREWPTVMLVGVLTIGVGIAVMVWPQQTLVVLSVLLGIQLLVFGLFRVIGAFSSETVSPGLVGFFGVLSMVAGVVVLRHPFETVVVLATVLGVVWIVGGAIDVVSAIADDTNPHRWLLAGAGLLSIAAGVIVVAWPAPTVTVVAWIAGIYLLLFGLLVCVEAFSLRKLAG